jgi:hypothetical protein
MPGPQDEFVARFRRWIIAKLKESSWVVYHGEDLERVAERLGLRPELLREAQESLAEDCRREGREPVRLGKPNAKARGGRAFVDIVLPKRVHEDWQAYCATRELAASVLLRSLIHRALVFPPPAQRRCDRGWIYRGKYMPVCLERPEGGGRYVTSIAADVTPGAKLALARRSRKLGVMPSAIVREAIVDLLEGRTKQLAIIGSVGGMWDDPDRYWSEV